MPRITELVRFGGSIGGYRLARYLCRLQPRILMYHRFSEYSRPGFASAECFEAQVKHIKRHYYPMTLADLCTAKFTTKDLPSNAVVITVDDGYHDFYKIAYPILKRHKVPATFFATSGFVDKRVWLWPDKVSWILDNTHYIEEAFSIGDIYVQPGQLTRELKASLWSELNAHLLSVDDEAKHRDIALLSERANVLVASVPPEQYQSVTWGQLAEMQQNGIEVGGHTVTHPSLGKVTRAQAEEEIRGCMDDLVQHLGPARRTFCYPNGMPSDFQEFLPRIIADAGFIAACVAFPDALGVMDRFALRRHVSGDNMFQFHKSVSGIELLGHKLRATKLLPVSQGEDRCAEAGSV